MRQVISGDIKASRLGFGCGSVLGRIGRSASLRAMCAAWDEGVTLFETAPSYGFGAAEQLLGTFMRGKRQQATVITKYGIPPQPLGSLKRLALPVARAVRSVQNLTGRRVSKVGDVRPSVTGAFSVEGMRTSLEQSLRNLQTDYIDILLLHNPSSEITQRNDIICELDAMGRAGKLRRAGLYADPNVVSEALKQGCPSLTAMELGFDPLDRTLPNLSATAEPAVLLLGNHPFGSAERVERFRVALGSLSEDQEIAGELRSKLRDPDWQVVLEATLELAFAPQGVDALIFSMMRPEHLRANIRALENSRFSREEVSLMGRHILALQGGAAK